MIMKNFFWTLSAGQRALDIPNKTINLFCGHDEEGTYIGEREAFSGPITRPLYRTGVKLTIIASFVLAIPIFLVMLPFTLVLDAFIGLLRLFSGKNEEAIPVPQNSRVI